MIARSENTHMVISGRAAQQNELIVKVCVCVVLFMRACFNCKMQEHNMVISGRDAQQNELIVKLCVCVLCSL